MKLSREKCLELAREANFSEKQWSAFFYNSGPYDVAMPVHNFVSLVRASVALGMEMAAKECEEQVETGAHIRCATAIRKLAEEVQRG